jgi:hypothetical protein
MNVAKAYEIALARTIRDYAVDLGGATVIRCWQSLREDQLWNKDGVDRTMPQISIKATPQRTMEDQVTLSCDGAIDIMTNTADDVDHAVISAMYSGVQGVLDKLAAQWKSGTGDEYAAFTAAMTEALEDDATVYSFGGFAFGEAVAPFDDDGINAIGVGFVLHFSRSDFL